MRSARFAKSSRRSRKPVASISRSAKRLGAKVIRRCLSPRPRAFGKEHGRVAVHFTVEHARVLGLALTVDIAVLELLRSIEGLEVLPFGEAEQCCGFGGTFSVAFPHVSSSMGRLKLDHILEAKPDYVVSADMSCLMHLGGLAEKEGRPVQYRHIAQILRDAIRHS